MAPWARFELATKRLTVALSYVLRTFIIFVIL